MQLTIIVPDPILLTIIRLFFAYRWAFWMRRAGEILCFHIRPEKLYWIFYFNYIEKYVYPPLNKSIGPGTILVSRITSFYPFKNPAND